MLQSNHAWGKVARLAVAAQKGDSLPVWHRNSDFDVLNRELNDWYRNLPLHHRWSTKNLLAMGALGHDLVSAEPSRRFRAELTRSRTGLLRDHCPSPPQRDRPAQDLPR